MEERLSSSKIEEKSKKLEEGFVHLARTKETNVLMSREEGDPLFTLVRRMPLISA